MLVSLVGCIVVSVDQLVPKNRAGFYELWSSTCQIAELHKQIWLSNRTCIQRNPFFWLELLQKNRVLIVPLVDISAYRFCISWLLDYEVHTSRLSKKSHLIQYVMQSLQQRQCRNSKLDLLMVYFLILALKCSWSFSWSLGINLRNVPSVLILLLSITFF